MQTFAEWIDENYPEDEVLNEKLGLLGGLGAGAVLAASMLSPAQGAAPMPPAGISQSQEHGEYSKVPFNKDLAVHLSPQMGLNPEKIAEMDDFDAWHEVMRKVNKTEQEMSRHNFALRKGAMGLKPKAWPKWYIKLGLYYNPQAPREVSTWKAPAPPKVAVKKINGIGGGD